MFVEAYIYTMMEGLGDGAVAATSVLGRVLPELEVTRYYL